MQLNQARCKPQHTAVERFWKLLQCLLFEIWISLCPPQQAIDAKTIKDVCTKYIYDKPPAIAAVGMYFNLFRDSHRDLCINPLDWLNTYQMPITHVHFNNWRNISTFSIVQDPNCVCYSSPFSIFIHFVCVFKTSVPGPIEQLPDYNRIRSGMYWMKTWPLWRELQKLVASSRLYSTITELNFTKYISLL